MKNKILKNCNMIRIIILIIVLLLSITYIKNFFENNELIHDDVKLKENISSNNGFALMLEQVDGTYEESNSSTWPANMIFNNELSGCIDANGNTIEDALEYDSTNNIMTTTVGEPVYCYVYFNRDKVAPLEFTFYLGGIDNPEYATDVNTKAYLSWKDIDIAYYCLTTNESSDDCTWVSVTGMSIETDYTLTSGDGEKTVYAYLKDFSENISPKVIDTIILDTKKPKIDYFNIGENTLLAKYTLMHI